MAMINVRDLGRVTGITTVLVKHGFGQLVRQAGMDFEGEPLDVKLPIGRRLRMVLIDLGPTFVKLGQVLSVRPDIVPRDIMEELGQLQDRVPPVSFDEIRQVVEGELHGPISEHFLEFDPTPLASASIAQVHRAVLPDGQIVAVKVQRPNIEPQIRSDLHILYTLAQVVAGRLDLPGLYTPVGIVREFDAAINQELDFLQEARAAERFRKNFRNVPQILVPRVHQELSTRRMLVLDLVHGRPFSEVFAAAAAGDLDAAQRRAAMSNLIEATYLQVFEHGFFHGDPHPGNLLLADDGRLAYLDFGLTGSLTGEMQDTIVQLFLALVYKNPESMALTLYRAGATDGRVDLRGFRSEIERLMSKYDGVSLSDLSNRASLVEFIEVAARFRIRLVPEYAVLARTGSILDGITRTLLGDVDIVAEVRPLAQRLVGHRLAPDRVGHDALKLLQQGQMAMRDVPLQLQQLMSDLEQGNLQVGIKDADASALREEVNRAGFRVSMAVCAASLSVSGALLLATWTPAPFGLPLAALLGMFISTVGVVLFAGLMLHTMFAAQMHPREWLRRARAVLRFFVAGGS